MLSFQCVFHVFIQKSGYHSFCKRVPEDVKTWKKAFYNFPFLILLVMLVFFVIGGFFFWLYSLPVIFMEKSVYVCVGGWGVGVGLKKDVQWG